jgi:hypothetical protein
VTTLADLEERVTALEAQGPEETTQPTFFTIDPGTGLVTADIAGIIRALGLTLPTAVTNPTPQSQINWVLPGDNPSVGQFEGQIQTFQDISSNIEMDIKATAVPGLQTLLRLNAYIGGAESAELDMATKPGDSTNTRVMTAASTTSVNSTRKIIDAAGNSDYVQVAIPTNAYSPFYVGRPIGLSYRGATFAIGAGAWAGIGWDTWDFGYDPSLFNGTAWVASSTGYWRFIFQVTYQNNAATQTAVSVGANSGSTLGSYISASLPAVNGFYGAQTFNKVYFLNAGQTIQPTIISSSSGLVISGNVSGVTATSFQRIA